MPGQTCRHVSPCTVYDASLQMYLCICLYVCICVYMVILKPDLVHILHIFCIVCCEHARRDLFVFFG